MTMIDRNHKVPAPPNSAPLAVPTPTPTQNTSPPTPPAKKFDQSVILQQSPTWSRAIIWTIVGVTTFGVVWASVAKIEEAIPATGKLEPQGTVKEVQAPVSGVVKDIYVEDGQRVKKGDTLLRLDSTTAQAQLQSLEKIRTALVQENQFYRQQMAEVVSPDRVSAENGQLRLPLELVSLTKSRAALGSENQLYRAQLRGSNEGTNFTAEQQQRLLSSRAELNSRVAAAELEVQQLERQMNQTQVQLAGAKDLLGVNQGILNDIEPIVKEGALARVQYLKQQQDVRSGRSEVDQLTIEQKRLQLAIAQAKENQQNTIALTKQDLFAKITQNEQEIAQIDSQLTKAIVENEKRLAEIDSQLSQSRLTLQYQDLKAPADGTVFDLKANTPGFVANSNEPILKIVPNDTLTAKVFLTNKDIGFVKEGMKADVRIDSFPFSEFGDVKGEVIWIGSDALPPDPIRPFYSFPAKVRLDKQSLLVNGKDIPLQSGMSVSVNLKVRDRTVMSIFTDLFTNKTESLKFVR
jgi:hemolysin D